MTYSGGVDIQKRVDMVGRREVPIRLGNPSTYISSGCVPSLLPGNRGKSHWFAGVLQREMLVILNVDPDNVFLEDEALPIPWNDGRHHYTFRPQFTVLRQGQVRYIIAVQWAAKVVKFGLLDILGSIQPFARAAGYQGIELWTDSQIRDPVRLANASLLFSVIPEKFDPHLIEDIRREAHKAGGPISIGRLRAAIRQQTRAFGAIAHLIGSGELVATDARRPIDDDLVVTALSLSIPRENENET